MLVVGGCGQEQTITDGTGSVEQGVEDNSSSTVHIDLTSVFEALCIARPDWSECIRWCELHPDSQACTEEVRAKANQ